MSPVRQGRTPSTSGTISFPLLSPGKTGVTKTISIPIWADTRTEGPGEIFFNKSGYAERTGHHHSQEAYGIIIDDD